MTKTANRKMIYYLYVKRIILLLIIVFLFARCNSSNENMSKHILIAHRGGVVDSLRHENSLAAAQEALRRGYKMLEVDIRETADEKAVLNHNPNLNRYYNCPKLVSDLTWEEIKRLKSDVDNSHPVSFDMIAKIVAGKAGLMLDIKGDNFSPSFYKEIESALQKYGLMESVIILGGEQAKRNLPDACHCIGYEDFIRVTKNGQVNSGRYYLFMIASQIDLSIVKIASEHRVPIIAAVNEFRYKMDGEDITLGAINDIKRLHNLGVSMFQIDSKYDFYFFDKD